MSAQNHISRMTAPAITARKGGEPIVCLTAYDAPTAAILDEHCDLILVGDSVGMVVHGLTTTCLLYTSPSPRDRTRSRMPSSA